MKGTAVRGAAKAENSRPLRMGARVGYAVNGLVHLLIGVIAISVAVGTGGEADQSGALGQLAGSPGGLALLWITVVGLTLLGIWQILHAFLSSGSDSTRKWAHRIGELGKAAAYLFVAATAYTFASGSTTNSVGSTQSLSARLLALPGGIFILFVFGALIVGIGVAFVVRGLTRRFLKSVNVPHGPLGRVAVALGVVGYVAKGIALAVVGVLFCVAAATINPSEATGLDGALKALTALPFGTVLLVLVGAGLIAYGVYCGFRARLARL
ncbi:MAG: rane protein [Microbacteriaceae bacterium]|nr:rane protein [Microbacteriaceae bacterium]